MFVQNHFPDTAFLLADLAASIRENQNRVDRYLQQDGAYEVFDPLHDADKTSPQTDEAFPATFWERFGIRHIIFNSPYNITASKSQWSITGSLAPYRWSALKKDGCVESLSACFSNCSVVQFADYANVHDAADFWNGLFADVIKPLEKKDLEFIFQLGDVTGRTVFEVDEVLDIIGQYGRHGRVNMVMDEQEANTLWDVLCGIHYPASPKEKYQLQFETMHIDTLLIFHNNGVRLISKEMQFDFAGRSLNNMHTYPHSKDFFLAGFRLGLLLRFDIPHAIVLGLVVSGAYRENASLPTSQTLLTYIDDWKSTISII